MYYVYIYTSCWFLGGTEALKPTQTLAQDWVLIRHEMATMNQIYDPNSFGQIVNMYVCIYVCVCMYVCMPVFVYIYVVSSFSVLSAYLCIE